MARTYKSPIDGKIFKTIPELEEYTKKNHLDKIPRKYKGDYVRYLFDFRNSPGKCQICGAPTEWDPKARRYKVLCEPVGNKDENNMNKEYIEGKANSCQEEMRKTYLENIRRTHNTDNLMNSIEYQEMLLSNRRIARKVKYKGDEMVVIGSLEERFVEVCNKVLDKKKDLKAPGPKVLWYPKGTSSSKYTITDFYIKSIDCIVSIKDGGFNNENHPTILKKREEDAYKFKGIVEAKRKFKAVIELEGPDDVDGFPTIYEEILRSIRNGERYIKFPSYYSTFVK